MTISTSSRVRRFNPIIIVLMSPLLGMGIGWFTNAINVRVCPEYFQRVFDVSGTPAFIRSLALTEGVVEGFIFGMVFGVVLALTITLSTRLRCPLSLTLRFLLAAIVTVLAGWLLGGLLGALLGSLAPSAWLERTFPVARFLPMSRFLWVGGSIWGVYMGTAIGIAICSIGLHLRWKRMVRLNSPQGFAVVLMTNGEPKG
jgi:hypothetical protein